MAHDVADGEDVEHVGAHLDVDGICLQRCVPWRTDSATPCCEDLGTNQPKASHDRHRTLPDQTHLLVFVPNAVRDVGNEKFMNDPCMKALGDMPFDGKRMVYGGFEILLET